MVEQQPMPERRPAKRRHILIAVLAGIVIAAGGVTVGVLLGGSGDDHGQGGTAQLAPADARQEYLDALDDAGITYTTDQNAVKIATDVVCDSLDEGSDVDTVYAFVKSTTEFPDHQAATVVAASVTYYCPEYTGDIADLDD